MALDFSPLQTIDPAGAFIQGQERAAERADRNALRQMQAEQMAMQRENMLAQRAEREALAAQRRAQTAKEMESQQWLGKMSALFESNNMPLNLQTARQGLSYAIQSGDKNAIEMMNKTVATLEETERDKAEMARITGGAGAAPAAARASAAPMVAPARAAGAPNELLFGTPFATGMNALAAPPAAPAAPAAPAEPMAGGFTRSQIGEMLASESKSVRERGERLSKLLPKEAESKLLSPEEEAQRIRIARESRPPAQPRPEPAPRTQQVTMSDGTLGIMNMDTGQVTPASLGGSPVKGKPSAFAEKTAIQHKQLSIDLDRTIAELEAAAKPKGLIAQSTGSGAGRLIDVGAAFIGQATPGAIAASRLAPIADMVLKMVPRFEGPQSDKDTKSYKEAAGQLADTSLPTKIRQAAAIEIVRLMRARKNQFVTQEMAAEGAAPAPASAVPNIDALLNKYR